MRNRVGRVRTSGDQCSQDFKNSGQHAVQRVTLSGRPRQRAAPSRLRCNAYTTNGNFVFGGASACEQKTTQVSKEAALCLKYNFLANAALDRNEVTLAIDYYDKALATGYADQQGVLLVRAGGGAANRCLTAVPFLRSTPKHLKSQTF